MAARCNSDVSVDITKSTLLKIEMVSANAFSLLSSRESVGRLHFYCGRILIFYFLLGFFAFAH